MLTKILSLVCRSYFVLVGIQEHYIICRVLVQHLASFSSQKDKVNWDITNAYSTEIAIKSNVVRTIAILMMVLCENHIGSTRGVVS